MKSMPLSKNTDTRFDLYFLSSFFKKKLEEMGFNVKPGENDVEVSRDGRAITLTYDRERGKFFLPLENKIIELRYVDEIDAVIGLYGYEI